MTARARLDPLAVRRALREAGLRPRHARSQNFLADPDVLQAILDLAEPGAAAGVLEIGPGLGILTGGLLDSGATVTAVELDHALAAHLRMVFADAIAGGALRLIEDDALDQDLPSLVPPPYRVVANLPYHITSPILHRLLGSSSPAERLVLMVQAEVAERIAAPPGRMSYLSVFVQYHAEIEVALRVAPEAFEPAPKVWSAVVVLRPHAARGVGSPAGPAQPVVPHVDDEDALWALVQAGFHERRKMLRNVLTRQLSVGVARVDAALAAVGITGDRRPQTLSVAEWIALYEVLR